MATRRPKRRITLIELIIACAVASLVVMQAVMVADSAGDVVKTQPASIVLEDQARMVLDRIAYSIVGAGRETLNPTMEGEHVIGLKYRASLGVTEGEVVWDDPEEVGLEEDTTVVWKENADLPDERRIVWSRLVRDLLDGEVFNDVDDNGNGLIDEDGLSFTIDGDLVTIRLTLQRALENGEIVSETVETVVACRH